MKKKYRLKSLFKINFKHPSFYLASLNLHNFITLHRQLDAEWKERENKAQEEFMKKKVKEEKELRRRQEEQA